MMATSSNSGSLLIRKEFTFKKLLTVKKYKEFCEFSEKCRPLKLKPEPFVD
jgi:hypothetical protein